MKFLALMLSAVILFPVTTVVAQEAQNKAYVQDGKIMVETKDGIESLDYPGRDGFTKQNVSKWTTREEVSPVAEALDVFKNKSKDYYRKRVWFVDNGTGLDQFYVEFTTDDPNARPYLLPDYNFAYYMGYSPTGVLGVYGVSLVDSGSTFFIDHSSHFNLVSCGQTQSYLVVEEDGELKQLIVYDPMGNKTDTTFAFGTTIEEIQKSLCP